MVNKTIPVAEFQRNTPIAVTSLMLMEDGIYHILLFSVFVFLLAVLKMIVKRTASHLFEFQQQIEVCMIVTP
jgi:hypothetical protein